MPGIVLRGCTNVTVTKIRTEGFDVGIVAEDVKNLRLSDHQSRDGTAIDFNNVSDFHIENVGAYFLEHRPLSEHPRAAEVRKQIAERLEQASPESRGAIASVVEEVFESKSADTFKIGWERLTALAANVVTIGTPIVDLMRSLFQAP